MSQTIEIQVCEMHEHELGDDSQPNFIGDGSCIIALRGTCQKCGFDVNMSYEGMCALYELSVNGINVLTQYNNWKTTKIIHKRTR